MQFTCELCGSTSNSGLASFQEKLWREGHTCVRRKRSVDAELAERIAAARSFKRIPLPEPSTPAETVEWHDSSFDRWGAPTQRQVVAKSWGGGNCLKACIASILGAEISRVPEPADDWSTEAQGWLSRYSERLAKQTGYRLDKLPPTVCPPRNPINSGSPPFARTATPIIASSVVTTSSFTIRPASIKAACRWIDWSMDCSSCRPGASCQCSACTAEATSRHERGRRGLTWHHDQHSASTPGKGCVHGRCSETATAVGIAVRPRSFPFIILFVPRTADAMSFRTWPPCATAAIA